MATNHFNPQSSCPLFLLPQELRDQIYSFVFTSTMLDKSPLIYYESDGTPPYQKLSLLRTCHRLSADIGTSWISQVTIEFDRPYDLIDALKPLPLTTLTQIRHLILGAYIFKYPRAEMDVFLIRNDEVLKLLLPIPLDVLTIYEPITCRGAYLEELLDKLIRLSNGHWKMLQMLTKDYDKADYIDVWKRIVAPHQGIEVQQESPAILIAHESLDMTDDNNGYWHADQSLFEPLGDQLSYFIFGGYKVYRRLFIKVQFLHTQQDSPTSRIRSFNNDLQLAIARSSLHVGLQGATQFS